MLPARIKNGIAIRLNTEIPENILCAPVISAGSVDNTGRPDVFPTALSLFLLYVFRYLLTDYNQIIQLS